MTIKFNSTFAKLKRVFNKTNAFISEHKEDIVVFAIAGAIALHSLGYFIRAVKL